MFAIAVTSLLAVAVIFLIARDAIRVRRMPSLRDGQLDDRLEQPVLSIVIPARNEADNIARCVAGALGQDYPNSEVIVVDDGSTDATPHILAGFAQRSPGRLTVVNGRPLPPGWVGKCNACLHGASHARGDWLVFLDADTVAGPALLRSMLAHARAQRLDALSLFPFNELPTLPERLILPTFFQFAFTAFPLHKIVVPEVAAHTAMANGQCLMVSAPAYWALGGHEAVKDRVLEDVEFAQALRRAGYRLGIATAFEHLRVRMYRTFGEIVQGMGKHAAAGRRASGWRAFWAVFRMTLTLVVPPALVPAAALMLAAQPEVLMAWVAAGASLAAYGASLWFWADRYRHWYHLPAWTALLVPAGWVIYVCIAVRGMLQVFFRRGVTWKGRTYVQVGGD